MKFNPNPSNHYSGELAYFDSFSGLISCKVIEVHFDHLNTFLVFCDIKITANEGSYKKGEVLKDLDCRYVIPRSKVHVKNGQYSISNSYYWITD